MYVKGVGPKVAEMLAAKGIQTAEDLLYHLPFAMRTAASASLEELVPARRQRDAEVRGAMLFGPAKCHLRVDCGTGTSALKCIWFHGSYLDAVSCRQTVALYGKGRPSRLLKIEDDQPQFELLPDETDDAETRLLEVADYAGIQSLGGSRLTRAGNGRQSFHLLEGIGRGCRSASGGDAARLNCRSGRLALREVHFSSEGTPMVQLQASATPPPATDLRRAVLLELGLERSGGGCGSARIGFQTTTRCASIRELLPFHPRRAEADAGRDCGRHAPAKPHAEIAAGDVAGQDIVALQAMLCHGKRLPGGVDGAPEIWHTALIGHAQAAGSVSRATVALLTGSLMKIASAQRVANQPGERNW